MSRICCVSLLLCATLCCDSIAQTNVRGHHEAGQTWLLWEEPLAPVASYRIFASTVDFVANGGTTAVGFEVGHILPADWNATRLKIMLPGQEWVVPKPGPGTYTLSATEALFVFTPHATTPLYFAVVVDGQSSVTAANMAGPIVQTLAPVTAHLQGTGLHPTGQTFRVFANWVDGNVDHTSGKPGYPVMGNASMNGCGAIFIVTDPVGAFPTSDIGAVVALHGGEGNLKNFTPSPSNNIGLTFDDAFLITPDGTINTVVGDVGSVWLGFEEDFDRFVDPYTAPPLADDTLVVDYLHRRVMWQIDWVLALYPIDANAVSVLGHSAGSRGAGMLRRLHPDRFAAAHLYSALLEHGSDSTALGTDIQNLTTTLPGNPGVTDVANEANVLSLTERDLPFTRVVIGRADIVGTAIWNTQGIDAYHAIDDSRMGTHLFWDERGHGLSTWNGAYFNGSTHLNGSSLTRYRLDESFPAFFDDDQDLALAGQQPDMGDGDPLNGDTYGTFGGYHDWEQDTIVDAADRWQCTYFLTALSANPKDNFTGTASQASVTIRRPQNFAPPANAGFFYVVERVSDGVVLEAGTGNVEADGLVAISGLPALPDPNRTQLSVYHNAQAEPYGTGCPGSGGFVPALGLIGTPNPGNAVTLRLEQGRGGSSAIFFFGLTPAALPLGFGCTLNVAPLLPTILGPVPLSPGGPGEGRLEVTTTIPLNSPSATFTMQGFVIDPGVTSGFSNTNGLEITIP
jgi:hypothetical protein